jgi:hypothetical protein
VSAGGIDASSGNSQRVTGIIRQNFPFTETKNLQFRAEHSNIFNHANFAVSVNDMNSPNVGQIQTSQPGRLVQFALKFLF